MEAEVAEEAGKMIEVGVEEEAAEEEAEEGTFTDHSWALLGIVATELLNKRILLLLYDM